MELEVKTKQVEEPKKATKKEVVTLEIGVASMEQMSTDSNVITVHQHPNDVTFIVSYGKDWKGDKPMPEGPVVVSKESAEHFISLKIGKIK